MRRKCPSEKCNQVTEKKESGLGDMWVWVCPVHGEVIYQGK